MVLPRVNSERDNHHTASLLSLRSKMFPFIFTSMILHSIWRGGVNQAQGLHSLKNSTLNGEDAVNQTRQLQHLNNSALNGIQEDDATHSGSFGFYDMAGMRSFIREQEVKTRIIGGQEAWAFSWPWQVSLRFATMSACGGAILAPLWVLSATHCFRRYNKASFWTVLAGKHDLDNPQEPGQQVVGVSKIITHQGYSTRTKVNDVALLKLQTPLVFNQFVRPIDIWTRSLGPFSKCTVTGWGSTRENGPRVHRLQEVNVTCLTLETCNQFYRGRVRPSMFCAGEIEGGVDACQGDSGGPISCFTGRSFKLAGVVSWGVGCGRARKPGVYTKVGVYVGWISNVMTNEMSMIHGDSGLLSDENTESCGEAETPATRLGPALAVLSVSKGFTYHVGGVTEACPNSWPWQVSLQSHSRHYCSGTLIHRRWVLAPRHCYSRAKDDMVVLGAHDLSVMPPQIIPVEEVFSLPQVRSFPPASDLSLLRLSVPARLGASVFPICVPDEDVELDDSWSCVTTGWGAIKATVEVSTDTLHQAKLGLVNQTVCRQHWGEDLIRDTHLCADPASSVSCMGDSGAPLFCQKHGVYYLFGMVTWGSHHCNADRPAVFSSVPAYHPWITDITEDV